MLQKVQPTDYLVACLQKSLSVAQDPTLWDLMGYPYPVHGLLQARILEWAAVPSPGDLPNLGIKPRSPTVQVDSLPAEPQGKPDHLVRRLHYETREQKQCLNRKGTPGRPMGPRSGRGAVTFYFKHVCFRNSSLKKKKKKEIQVFILYFKINEQDLPKCTLHRI